jgi:hypothetical protein
MARSFWAEGRMSFRWLDGTMTVTRALKVAASGDKRLFVREDKTKESPSSPSIPEGSEVQCETAEHDFILNKDALSQNYLIGDYGPHEEDDESPFQYWFKMMARNSTVYFGTSFLQRMQHPSFELNSIEAVEQGDEDLVRIGYSYEGKYVFESGFVELDIGKNWAVRKVEINCRNKKNFPPIELKSDVQYKKIDDTRYFPSRMEFFGRTPKAEVYEHAIVEFKDIWLGPPPDEMFRLTGYGLPDIPLRPMPQASIFTYSNPLFWLTLAASLISFALLWILRRREAGMEQAP